MTRVPSPARRAWIVAVALACVLLVVFVLYRRDPLDSTSATPPTETVEAAERLAQPATEATTIPTPVSTVAESRIELQQGVSPERPQYTNVEINGQIRLAGLEGTYPVFTVQLASEHDQPSQVQTKSDGSFESRRNATRADWRVRHTVQVMFDQTPLQEFAIEADAFVQIEGTQTWRAHVECTLTDMWLLRGRLLSEQGEAVKEGAATLVALEDVEVPSRELGTVRTTEDGSFELVTKRDAARPLLVLHARNHLPLRRELTYPPSGILDLGDIVLRRGVSLTGCIVSSLPPEYRANFVAVHARRDGTDFLNSRTSDSLMWVDGDVSWSYLAPTVGVDGCFELHGLAEGEYSLSPEHREMISLLRLPSTSVVAPARDLVLHDPGAVIRLALQANDGTELTEDELRSARLHYTNSRGRAGETLIFGQDGMRPLLVPPEFKLSAQLRVVGFASTAFELVGPREGGVMDFTVELRRLAKPRTLTIEVVREEGDVVGMASFTVESEESSGWEEVSQMTYNSESGRYVLPNVPAARVRVTVDSDWRTILSGSDFSQRVQLLLDETSPDTLRVVLPAGGLLELDVTDPDGAPVTARCTLSHEGEPLGETMFLDRSGSNSMFGGWVGPNGSARNLWPLPGGEYVLHVEFDGFVAQDVPLKIVPKSTVHHAVQLQRAP